MRPIFSVLTYIFNSLGRLGVAHKNESNWTPYKGGKKGPKKGTHKKPIRIFKLNEANDRLEDIFTNHGFGGKIDHSTRDLFAKFYVLLMENQKNENMTRLVSIKDIGIKHFIDSIIINELTHLKFPLLDMGTGPGFPGIPLKIILGEDKKIILAEGVQKRVQFLKSVRDGLDLKGLDIIGRNVTPDFVYPVQGVITRALEDARNTLANVINCLQVDGCVYLMKGPNVGPEIEVALKTWGKYFQLEHNKEYILPNTTYERRLLIFRKIKEKKEETSEKSNLKYPFDQSKVNK